MKRSIRPLRLERETLRSLEPEQLQRVVGGRVPTDSDTFHNSCDPTDGSFFFLCFSTLPTYC